MTDQNFGAHPNQGSRMWPQSHGAPYQQQQHVPYGHHYNGYVWAKTREAVRAQHTAVPPIVPFTPHYSQRYTHPALHYQSVESQSASPGYTQHGEYPPTDYQEEAQSTATLTKPNADCVSSLYQYTNSGSAGAASASSEDEAEYPTVYYAAGSEVQEASNKAQEGEEDQAGIMRDDELFLLAQILLAYTDVLNVEDVSATTPTITAAETSNVSIGLHHPLGAERMNATQHQHQHQHMHQHVYGFPHQHHEAAAATAALGVTHHLNPRAAHFAKLATDQQQRTATKSLLGPYNVPQVAIDSLAEQRMGDVPHAVRPLIMIEEKQDLIFHAHFWARCKAIAVDVKGYQDRTCLLQISTERQDFIIDTLKLWYHVPMLHALFASQHIVKIFHDANHDIKWLKRDFGFELDGMFDTYIASGIMLKSRGQSLGKIIEARWGLHPDFDKKRKKYNWSARPLTSELIDHARVDTSYLFDIYIEFVFHLMATGEFDNVLAKSLQVCQRAKRYERIAPPRFVAIHE